MFVFIQVFFFFSTDIQECYEVTLQLNKEQTVVKDNSREDAWEVILHPHAIEHMFYVYILSGVTRAVVCCV